MREMNKSIAFLIFTVCFATADFFAANAATCPVADITRCLDSACSINIALNPATRCQLCGTSGAGNAENTGLKNISFGTSSRNVLSGTELKSAPNDPGARYAWASGECIKKVSGCTAEDVSNIYDKLIEQSCRSAGITAEMNSLTSALNKTKNIDTCNSETLLCLTDTKRCGVDFSGCENDSDFNNFFSACASEVNGCDNLLTDTRNNMISQRDAAVNGKDTLISNIVKSYQTKRENGLKSAMDSCANNKAREDCIKTTCQNNMKNKCVAGFESEKSMATLLCKFYDTACERLR